MRRRVIFVLAMVTLGVLGLSGWSSYRFIAARRHAELAVKETVESIRHMGALEPLDAHAITNAAVGSASVRIASTNPVLFRVSAITPWPDGMIYEFDSKEPERGVYHYLF